MNIIVASNNEGKIKEFKKILEPLGYNVISQKEAGINIEVNETGTTFRENSELKARAIYEITHTQVLADDSGIEVEYLNNEPGIYSARYKGLKTDEEKRNYILNQLEGIEPSKRNARFVCCICYINKEGKESFAEGYWNGKIAMQAKGENGFGYDPIFIPNGEKRTSAEMLPEEKNAVSHRAVALKKLLEILK